MKKDIKQTLINNGYPNNFVDKHINTTLENLKNNNKNNQQNEEEKTSLSSIAIKLTPTTNKTRPV